VTSPGSCLCWSPEIYGQHYVHFSRLTSPFLDTCWCPLVYQPRLSVSGADQVGTTVPSPPPPRDHKASSEGRKNSHPEGRGWTEDLVTIFPERNVWL
jgi:hypothetical protein